jgi:hypothetical protein
MTRVSAFRGTWQPNRRPYVVLTPDAYVSIQGETQVITCGECRREININKYLTGISTEASVDSAPGSATISLSVPDTDVNDFYVEGELVIISMMEIEIFAKGYYTIGGTPQYYRIFWGMVNTVTKSWSNGVTSISIQCSDILRWWELTNFATNTAWIDQAKTQSGVSFWGNHFAGMNPYTVMIALARDAMGDFSITQGSFLSFRPEDGSNQRVIGQYSKDIMAYWQLKFGNIWNSLVLYGSSGQAYTMSGTPGNVSPLDISRKIFEEEEVNLNLNKASGLFKVNPNEIAAFKKELSAAPGVNFFQTDSQTKLQIAQTCKEQAGGYEFYCDTTGDIVFKPPFYNLNVLPNKPVSWIQDFEILDDSITETERDVFTHVTSHGNAFGGVMDWGLNSDITTPRTGVIDWHLLKRYGWRRVDVQIEWAGDAKKLFYHLLDHIDKINAKRVSGTITIPMRPEIRMGFPVWIPKYDAFFYILGVSHQFSPGGTATSSLTLSAKRSKFIAPKNIGRIIRSNSSPKTFTNPTTGKQQTHTEYTYDISFPSNSAETTGYSSDGQNDGSGGPAILRNTKTGKILGFPKAVMVYRESLDGKTLAKIIESSGSTKAHDPKSQDKNKPEGPENTYNQKTGDILAKLYQNGKNEAIDRLRLNRYEAGMTNSGVYDYAHDVEGDFQEFSVIPVDKISWGSGSGMGEGVTISADAMARDQDNKKSELLSLQQQEKDALKAYNFALKDKDQIARDLASAKKKTKIVNNQLPSEISQLQVSYELSKSTVVSAKTKLDEIRVDIRKLNVAIKTPRKLTSINVMVRPVSDEFGFEVIGHYRYGRGAYVDRGGVQIPNPGEVSQNPQTSVNQLNIQFAAQGGLLTDNPVENNLGPESPSFAAAFEQMMPDDYVTGASFKGANYSGDQTPENINPTGQRTYTDAINLKVTSTGKAVFAEADAVRRAITLAELSPTTSTGLDRVGVNRCSCSLGKTSWLTILPQSLVQQVLGQAASYKVNSDIGVIEQSGAAELGISYTHDQTTDDQTVGVAAGAGDFNVEAVGGFFSVLRQYLMQKFTTEYQSNIEREKYDRSGGRNVSRPGEEQDNVLGDPQSALFQRAAMGDPAALQQMQGEANFNFGRTTQASKELSDTFKKDGPFDNLGANLANLPGSIYDASKRNPISVTTGPSQATVNPGTKPQYQVPGRIPKIGETINPGLSPNTPTFGSS